jgi:putative membrane protein
MRKYILTALKGMGMGAADVVPGVSGGTIAFISGIYEELINSLKSINLKALRMLLRFDLRAFWQAINGNFLLSVFAGVIISVVSLANLLTYLLATYPVLVWAFFFGLIVGSAIMIGRKIKKWNAGVVIALVVGVVIAYLITALSPTQTTEALWFVFISGMIAITAMILPGISGSFMLLLLGKYKFILTSLTEIDVKVIITFIIGCASGLLAFSRVLSWMFARFHDLTVALLTGFMIGSLNKVWPWKETVEWGTDRHGNEIPLVQDNILPTAFDGEPYMWSAIALAAGALALIMFLESLGKKDRQV